MDHYIYLKNKQNNHYIWNIPHYHLHHAYFRIKETSNNINNDKIIISPNSPKVLFTIRTCITSDNYAPLSLITVSLNKNIPQLTSKRQN